MKTMLFAAAVLAIGIGSAFAAEGAGDGGFFNNTPASGRHEMASGHIDRSFTAPKPPSTAFENNGLEG